MGSVHALNKTLLWWEELVKGLTNFTALLWGQRGLPWVCYCLAGPEENQKVALAANYIHRITRTLVMLTYLQTET